MAPQRQWPWRSVGEGVVMGLPPAVGGVSVGGGYQKPIVFAWANIGAGNPVRKFQLRVMSAVT